MDKILFEAAADSEHGSAAEGDAFAAAQMSEIASLVDADDANSVDFDQDGNGGGYVNQDQEDGSGEDDAGDEEEEGEGGEGAEDAVSRDDGGEVSDGGESEGNSSEGGGGGDDNTDAIGEHLRQRREQAAANKEAREMRRRHGVTAAAYASHPAAARLADVTAANAGLHQEIDGLVDDDDDKLGSRVGSAGNASKRNSRLSRVSSRSGRSGSRSSGVSSRSGRSSTHRSRGKHGHGRRASRDDSSSVVSATAYMSDARRMQTSMMRDRMLKMTYRRELNRMKREGTYDGEIPTMEDEMEIWKLEFFHATNDRENEKRLKFMKDCVKIIYAMFMVLNRSFGMLHNKGFREKLYEYLDSPQNSGVLLRLSRKYFPNMAQFSDEVTLALPIIVMLIEHHFMNGGGVAVFQRIAKMLGLGDIDEAVIDTGDDKEGSKIETVGQEDVPAVLNATGIGNMISTYGGRIVSAVTSNPEVSRQVREAGGAHPHADDDDDVSDVGSSAVAGEDEDDGEDVDYDDESADAGARREYHPSEFGIA
jgi:hypothetical protein